MSYRRLVPCYPAIALLLFLTVLPARATPISVAGGNLTAQSLNTLRMVPMASDLATASGQGGVTVRNNIQRAATSPSTSPATKLSKIRIAFTQNNNVFIQNLDGSARDVVTTRGTSPEAHDSLVYPFYQWSPDGRFLLLLRSRAYSALDILLLDTHGNVLRTLATGLSNQGLYPTWATDGDEIAYLGSGGMIHEVDVDGRTIQTYPFKSQGYGCGGGGPRPRTLLLYWGETGYDGTVPALSWSIRRHLAAISPNCGSPALISDTLTGQVRPLFTDRWTEAALSPAGNLASTTICQTSSPPPAYFYFFEQCAWIADARTGARIADLGLGELPVWSPDGRFVYFERRAPLHLLPMQGPWLGQEGAVYGPEVSITESVFASSIWRARADGSQPTRIATLDAYATGPLQVTADGHSLIFSTVDNAWALYRHLLPGGVFTAGLMAAYGPQVNIRRLDLVSGKVTLIVHDAGRPAVRP